MTGDQGFRPTCPRCWKKAPANTKWCPSCGAWMLYDPPPPLPKKPSRSLAW